MYASTQTYLCIAIELYIYKYIYSYGVSRAFDLSRGKGMVDGGSTGGGSLEIAADRIIFYLHGVGGVLIL